MKSEYLKSKKFYEIVFICCAFAGIIAWAAGIILSGNSSEQFDIFFLNTQDFFADITNVIGYSANPGIHTLKRIILEHLREHIRLSYI